MEPANAGYVKADNFPRFKNPPWAYPHTYRTEKEYSGIQAFPKSAEYIFSHWQLAFQTGSNKLKELLPFSNSLSWVPTTLEGKGIPVFLVAHFKKVGEETPDQDPADAPSAGGPEWGEQDDHDADPDGDQEIENPTTVEVLNRIDATISDLEDVRRIIGGVGWKGGWTWACEQLDKGHVVRQASASGIVRYKLDEEGQRRILWAFPHATDPMGVNEKWENANIFLSDFEATDWEIVFPF